MKSLIRLSLLLLLAAVLVQGMPTSSRGRCLCITAGAPVIHPKHIAKVEIYGQSSSCQQVEVIITLKGSGQRKCLNSTSKLASRMIQKFLKRNK
ncbi:C-X-C motif chemokine 11-like [Dermochelys coriacea]|uniref:C-X-C motif chemokine 11-like n=1 Tax=Dermochelys coriacea TaxID=27794 RepID=UPI0018E896A5|nr:C-X-C motif chemokine 11-like [Dermochelys coriacea]